MICKKKWIFAIFFRHVRKCSRHRGYTLCKKYGTLMRDLHVDIANCCCSESGGILWIINELMNYYTQCHFTMQTSHINIHLHVIKYSKAFLPRNLLNVSNCLWTPTDRMRLQYNNGIHILSLYQSTHSLYTYKSRPNPGAITHLI